jgi:hypothetical protein
MPRAEATRHEGPAAPGSLGGEVNLGHGNGSWPCHAQWWPRVGGPLGPVKEERMKKTCGLARVGKKGERRKKT